MGLNLMYITNQPKVAQIAETSGVNWIFIDLEINGKVERQGHLDTVISHHKIDDIKKVKRVLSRSELLVRVNPVYGGSKQEIPRVICDGADIVMLPFFRTAEEVSTFISIVGKQAKTMLLLETPEAVENIDDILALDGIDYIHIGLNDLHLGYGLKFMFELLADGTVERLCDKIRVAGIPYGFGGIAQLGRGDLPAENIIAEHYRLGSSMVILSRSFCNVGSRVDFSSLHELFHMGVKAIRDYEDTLVTKDERYFEDNKRIIIDKVNEIRNQLSRR